MVAQRDLLVMRKARRMLKKDSTKTDASYRSAAMGSKVPRGTRSVEVTRNVINVLINRKCSRVSGFMRVSSAALVQQPTSSE